ncbi:GNAT family N-acetyltransferase [Streptomyces sp. NRRL F-4428]|uniref:GNAT family N-acetyltransferase n=1 Tax=Streptomyces sp. NRRL F-4428 TaxID=1609137 RepID=UPI003B63627C
MPAPSPRDGSSCHLTMGHPGSSEKVPEVPGRRPGVFVVERDGATIGTVTLDRRDAERPGHVRPGAGEAELGYMFLPKVWGRGYALEACSAALDWFADAFPGEPVVLCTQVANDRSVRVAQKLGFTEVERFEEFGAEQWFGVWSPVPRSRTVHPKRQVRPTTHY